MFRQIFSFLLLLIFTAFAMQNAGKPANPFVFEPVDLGILQQGIKKNVEIKGKNTSSQSIEIENVFDQMTGGENFTYPQKNKSGAEF